jgi:ribose-phosphate pyrophosphokinase
LRTGNPRRVTLCVTHFYPSQEVRENLNTPALDEILTTSTIPTILNRDSQGRLRRKMAVLKLAQWMSGALLAMLGQSPRRYEHDFYSVDMSSKNPRGGREGFSNKL